MSPSSGFEQQRKDTGMFATNRHGVVEHHGSIDIRELIRRRTFDHPVGTMWRSPFNGRGSPRSILTRRAWNCGCEPAASRPCRWLGRVAARSASGCAWSAQAATAKSPNFTRSPDLSLSGVRRPLVCVAAAERERPPLPRGTEALSEVGRRKGAPIARRFPPRPRCCSVNSRGHKRWTAQRF